MAKELFNQNLATDFDDNDRLAASIPGASGGKNMLWSKFKEILLNLLSTFNWIDFTPQDPAPSHTEGRLFYDDVEKTWTAYNDITGVSLQIGEELRARLTNDTGVTVTNGTVVAITGGSGNNITIELLDATNRGSSIRAVGLITNDVINGGEGYTVSFGKVRGLNTSTCNVGDTIFGDPAVLGGYTNVRPTAPFYPVRVGVCMVSSTTDGIIYVDTNAFNGSDTTANIDGVFNGIVLDTPNISFSLETNVLYADLTNEKYPTRNLPFIIDGVRYNLDTLTNTGSGGAARVAVPWGTSTVKENSILYIYLNAGTPTFAISSTEPSVPYCTVCKVSLFDEAKYTALGRPFAYRRNNNTQDRIEGVHTGSHGLFEEILWWIRSMGSAWIDGQVGNATVNNTTIRLALTAGNARQFRRSSVPLFDGLNYQILNDAANVVTYAAATNLTSITTTAGGSANDLLSNNRFYTIRLFYQLNSNGVGNSVIATRPTGYYTTGQEAIDDAFGYATEFNDTDIEEIIYPLYDLVIGRTGTGGTTIALVQLTDRRTKIPFGAGGGGATGGGGINDKVRVSATDTTPGYLTTKSTFGDEFTTTTVSPAGNESLYTIFKGWIYNAARTFKGIFSMASLTADRTFSWPDISGLVAVNLMTSVFQFRGQVNGGYKVITFSATPTINLNEGNSQIMTLTGNVTSLTLSNKVNGGSYIIYLVQDATGSRTIETPDSTFGSPVDGTPAFITTSLGVNIINVNVDPAGVTYYSVITRTP